MRFAYLLLWPLLLVLAQPAGGQSASRLTTSRILRQALGLDQFLAPDAQIEIVTAGLAHAESPMWVPDSSMLLFSDTKTRTVYRWSAMGSLTKFLPTSGYTGQLPYSAEPGSNCLALDGRGNRLLCEHGDRRLASRPLASKGGKRTLTDNFRGRRYNSPNDVVAHPANGSRYFTDPPYGLPQQGQDPLRETPVSGVYRWDAQGRVSCEISDLSRPNSLAFSPDGRTLYVVAGTFLCRVKTLT